MERTKMPRIKRAAQFAPFEALKGLHDALERKRLEHIAKQKNTTIESYDINNIEKDDSGNIDD